MYKEKTANYPRLKTDMLFADYDNNYNFSGCLDNAIKFIEKIQLLDQNLWARFVEQYRMLDADYDNGWRGEYWGKMMRGACLTYSYTRNSKLYNILSDSVKELLDCQETDGRMSTYAKNHEFQDWDMWCRKYVLLGMQYFLEICEDVNLSAKIVKSMCAQVDYMIEYIGDEGDKMEITLTSDFWRGLNSSSILEPVVRLYDITNDKKYLDFATHIVNCGGTEIENLFELAFEDELYPYQYPMTKAYEMISCFEGLLEYYRATGIEKYKTAVINFAEKLLESEITVIGSCGCTHELFDNAFVRQANTTNGPSQETCVTVTLMKFMYQMTLLTGDSKYVDVFEVSLYNAYLGAINTENIIEMAAVNQLPGCIPEALPFGSYSPLTAGTRGKDVGGLKLMADNHFYGCCACIGSVGGGLVPKMALMTARDGFCMNLYINGTVESRTPENGTVTFITETKYPVCGDVKVTLKLEKSENFKMSFRNPNWSKNTKISVNGQDISATEDKITVERIWNDGDVIEIGFDMRTRAIFPTPYGSRILMTKPVMKTDFYIVPVFDKEDPKAKDHIALMRGPIVLAQDNRLGYSVDDAVSIETKDGFVDVEIAEENSAFDTILEVKVPLTDGTKMTLVDYSSAGKTWCEESKMAAWILTK